MFEESSLTQVQFIISLLKIRLDQHPDNNPIIITLSDKPSVFDDFFGCDAEINYKPYPHKSLSTQIFDFYGTIKRIDSKGNMHGILISNFYQNIIERELYVAFMECISKLHTDTLLIFTQQNNVCIAHNGRITHLSLAFNNEDLHYVLPNMIPLSKGSRVNVEAFGFAQPGTIIDYEFDKKQKEIIYTVRCEKNIYHKVNYYQIFNRTNPKIYRSAKRNALKQKNYEICLRHTVSPRENPSDPSHPFHFIFLAFVESAKQCNEYIRSKENAQMETIIHQLQECGFCFLFYHTLIRETSEEVKTYRREIEKEEEDADPNPDAQRRIGDVNRLNDFMDYLQKEAGVYKVNKYEHPKPFEYDDLCKQCSSILDNVGSNNKVFVCHIIEREREELICCSKDDNKSDSDDDDDDSQDDHDDEWNIDEGAVKKYEIKIHSSFEYSIKYDFEICALPSKVMTIEEVMIEIKEKWKWGTMDQRLLNYFHANDIFNVYDLSLMNGLKAKLKQQRNDEDMQRMYKTFNGFVYRFDEFLKCQSDNELKQNLVHNVEVSRNAKCLQQIVKNYKCRFEDDGNNTLVIGYNPLQCVVATSKEIREVTHCVHLYQAAHDEGFYSDSMLNAVFPDWMSPKQLSYDRMEADDNKEKRRSLVDVLFQLLRRNQRYDIILVPASVNLDKIFLSDSCAVVAPDYQAVAEYQTMFLYKGNVYRIKNKSMVFDENERIYMDEVKVTLRHLMDKSDKNGKAKYIRTSSRDRIDKWLNIGCGACFLQQTNGQSTKIVMREEKQLRECLFLNGIDCKIPYNKDIVEFDKKCAICMDLQINPATIGNEECPHSFCHKCIDQWYKMRKVQESEPKCPLCRRAIIKIEYNKEMEREMMQGIPLTVYQQIVDENESLYQRLRAADAFEQTMSQHN